MQALNLSLFGIYLAFTVALGIWVGRRKGADSRGYFLAGDELPWYAIGGSIIAANISTEHFIGMVGVTNQFIVQRCLGARSEWDARMGVVFAGFMKVLLPLLVVLPGIIAFRLYPGLPDKDLAFPTLVRELLPAGLSGIVMAGLASGMLSHISSVCT